MKSIAFANPAPKTSSFRGSALVHICTSSHPPASGAVVRKATMAVAQPAQETEKFDQVVMKTYGRYSIAMSHGKGAKLWDTTGKQYLDFVAGIATCTLGHADARVNDAIIQQLNRLSHVSNLYYIPEQGRLAEWLVQNSPADKVFFCNSGAEANEAAIKLARKNWHLHHDSGSPVIITAWQSFHGRTLATITATAQPKYHHNFGPLVPGFEYVTYNDVDDLRAVAGRVGDNLAAILLEPLQGEGGIHAGDAAFFRAAREICDEKRALLMCDEVQVGMGRTGKLWGHEWTTVIPDVITAAKGLGGGVPIGAMLCSDWCNVFAPGDHASTFGGNPLACAAGAAVGEALLMDGVLANVRERGAQLEVGLEAVATRVASIKEVRGYGLIRGVEVSVPAGEVVKEAMARGLLLVPAGGSVVRFVPPLVVTEEEIEQAVEIFEDAMLSVMDRE